MRPLVPIFSEQAERGDSLAFLVICNILCEKRIGAVLAILIIRRVLEKHRVSKANKEVQCHISN